MTGPEIDWNEEGPYPDRSMKPTDDPKDGPEMDWV